MFAPHTKGGDRLRSHSNANYLNKTLCQRKLLDRETCLSLLLLAVLSDPSVEYGGKLEPPKPRCVHVAVWVLNDAHVGSCHALPQSVYKRGLEVIGHTQILRG